MKILELQGLRGIAVLSVLVFHFYFRWGGSPHQDQNLYPFDPANGLLGSWLGVLWIGVELFFMISGFVIALSLSRSANLIQFWVQRFARLWPPLLLILPLVWLTLQFAPSLEGASKELTDLAGSMSLIKPEFLSLIIPGNHEFEYTTGVLWTLWIELLFYVLASFIYFSKLPLLKSLMIFGGVVSAIEIVSRTRLWLDVPPWANYVSTFLTGGLSNFIWWFIAGVAIQSIRLSDGRKLIGWLSFLIAGVLTTGLGWLKNPADASAFVWANLIIFVLFSTVANPKVDLGLNSKPLVILGAMSYELYLIHEALGMSLLQLIRVGTPFRHPTIGIAAAGVCIVLAYVIYQLWSRKACLWTKNKLTKVWSVRKSLDDRNAHNG